MSMLGALVGETSGLGRRAYDRFIATLEQGGMVESPVLQLLPNAEAIDPFKIPAGNVIEVSADSTLVSELINRQPTTAISYLELSESMVNSANIAAITEKLKAIAPGIIEDHAPFSLNVADTAHWEANLISGRLAILREKLFGKKKDKKDKKDKKGKKDKKDKKTKSSFLESALNDEQPTYSYILVVTSEAGPKLMEQYVQTIEASCTTMGEVACHSATSLVQSHLSRNNNRLLYRVGEQMGWSIPCQVDSSSVFHNQAEFAPPLMAIPTSTQLNNTIVLVGDKVRLFNGAIDMLQSGGLNQAFVDLGPEIGMAQFTVPVRRECLALPVGVRREAIGREFVAKAQPISNVATFAGANVASSPQFKQGYYQKASEEFLNACQQLCSANTELAVDPCIFTPIFTIVGKDYVEH